MKKWNIPKDFVNLKYPDEILQEFADALTRDTNNTLLGQVTETISYDSNDRPKIYYSLHVYISKLKQTYRLFEIEQTEDKPYPVNLKIILYSSSNIYDNLKDAKSLNDKLDELAKDINVGNLLAHFIRLSEIKE